MKYQLTSSDIKKSNEDDDSFFFTNTLESKDTSDQDTVSKWKYLYDTNNLVSNFVDDYSIPLKIIDDIMRKD